MKLLSARLHNIRLHSYDHDSKKFYSTLGAEPIGLLSRALVMSSNELPEIEDGKLVYTNVNALLASTILQQLYTRVVF